MTHMDPTTSEHHLRMFRLEHDPFGLCTPTHLRAPDPATSEFQVALRFAVGWTANWYWRMRDHGSGPAVAAAWTLQAVRAEALQRTMAPHGNVNDPVGLRVDRTIVAAFARVALVGGDRCPTVTRALRALARTA